MKQTINQTKSLINSFDAIERSSDYYNSTKKRQIKFTNYISLISLFSDLFFIGYYSFIGFDALMEPIIVLYVSILIFLIPIILNRLKYYIPAKIFIYAYNTGLVILFSLYYFGSKPGLHVFLLIFGIIPIFICSSKRVKYIIFTLNFLVFILIEFLSGYITPNVVFPVEYIDLTRSTAIVMSFLGLTVVMIIFFRQVDIKEALLYEQNNRIEQQNTEQDKLNIKLKKKIRKLSSNQVSLKEANLVRSKIYTILSHDLRGPLSTIYNLLKIILSDYSELTDDYKKQIISNIHDSIGNSTMLLENLLDWSRLNTDNLNPNPEKLNLFEIAGTAIVLHKENIVNKDINIENSISQEIFIFSDNYMVSTIFRNLLSNAIKFTPKSGSVIFSADIKENNIINVSVSDTGIGMNLNEINSLFSVDDNFYRAGTNNEQGSGLGLHICKEFIENMGGSLSLSSTPGKGSVFSFTLKKT